MAERDTYSEEYPLALAALNRRADRSRLQRGEMSMATGVDGRKVGAIEKFPGMALLRDLSLSNVQWFQYVEVQKGTTDYAFRGFLVHHQDAGTWKVTFHYYDESGATWGSQDIITLDLGMTSVISADGNGKFIYVGVRGGTAKSVRHTGAAWQIKDMGYSAGYDSVTAPAVATVAAGGLLGDGKYRVGFRYYDENRNVYSAMAVTEHTIDEGDEDNRISVGRGGAETPNTDGFTHILLYRSLSNLSAATPYTVGLLFHEKTIACAADAWSDHVGDEISDQALLLQDVYDPWLDSVGAPPDSGEVAYYQGTTFMGSDGSSGTAVATVQFSTLHEHEPEIFPVDNIHRWSAEDGIIQRFVKVGDLMYGWTRNSAMRFAKVGNQLSIDRVFGGRGIVGRGAVGAIGRSMVAVTDSGVMDVDSTSGSMKVIGALDRVIFEDWADHLSDVVVTSDAALGATFITNTYPGQQGSGEIYETYVIWHTTGAVTKLEDMTFEWATEGPNPTTGNQSRAWFITTAGKVFGADLTNDYRNMWGLDPAAVTLYGTATGGDATSLIDAGATFSDDMVGATVYVFDSDGNWQKSTVSSRAGSDLTLSDPLDPAIASGTVYTIAPVPLRLRLWNVAHANKSLRDFGRRVIRDVGILADNFVGTYDPAANPAARWLLGAYRNFEDTVAASLLLDFTDDPSEDEYRFGGLNVGGHGVEPYIEHISADTGFHLLSLVVNGKITPNRGIGS